MMPTIKDVAREAGVSVGTVSNVFNGKDTVLPENRDNVLRAAKRLGFRFNLAAKTLRTKSSRDIGLILPSISNPFYPELARGVEDAANGAGLTVLLCNGDRNTKKEREYINLLIAKNVSGIILLKPQMNPPEIDDLGRFAPTVLVDVGLPRNSRHSVVNVDDRGGVLAGMEHLRRHGHGRIAFIRGLNDSLSSQNRVDAYRDFLLDEGIPVREEYIFQGDYSWASGREAARKFLSLSRPPTAVFAANDLMAMGCMLEARTRGLDVPGDLSIVGYDNLELTNLYFPRLTTINQPKYEIGAKSVELLLRGLDAGGGAAGETVILPTGLVERESVSPPRQELREPVAATGSAP